MISLNALVYSCAALLIAALGMMAVAETQKEAQQTLRMEICFKHHHTWHREKCQTINAATGTTDE